MKFALLILDSNDPVSGPPPGVFYVKTYDPHALGGVGVVDVTSDIDGAAQFDTLAEALAFYLQESGIRADGLPNRPLTASSVQFVPVKS